MGPGSESSCTQALESSGFKSHSKMFLQKIGGENKHCFVSVRRGVERNCPSYPLLSVLKAEDANLGRIEEHLRV